LDRNVIALLLGLSAVVCASTSLAAPVSVRTPTPFAAAPVVAAVTTSCPAVYSNTTHSTGYYYAPGALKEVLDDLHLAGLPPFQLCGFDLRYFKPSPEPVSVRVTFYANDPADGVPGPIQAGPYYFSGLPSGSQQLHFDVPGGMVLGPDVWMGVAFFAEDAGLVIAQPPTVGSSHDVFYQYPENGYFNFGGSPTADFGLAVYASGPVSGSISGTVFQDVNLDGLRDSLELGMPNWTVLLSGPVNTSTLTDSAGGYLFSALPVGTYTVSLQLEPGCTQTGPPGGVWVVSVSDTTPVFTEADFPTHCPECPLEREWRRGTPITVTEGPHYWPDDETLLRMRPNDAIALRVLAEDQDMLLQTCTDCDGRITSRKWGPYGDRLIYRWRLSGPGRIIGSAAATESTTVLYQIPKCDWGAQTLMMATIDVDIENRANDKAVDLPLLGAQFRISMFKSCAELPGWIKVRVDVDPPFPNSPEIIDEVSDGTCVPRPPSWETHAPILLTDPGTITEAPDLCPDYLTLLSVGGFDLDYLTLKCEDPSPDCAPTAARSFEVDPCRYQWSNSGPGGQFPLGTTGPVVAFRRSRASTGRVECEVRDSGTEAPDLPVLAGPLTIAKAKRPAAVVVKAENGEEDSLVARIASIRYDDLGYEVRYMSMPTASAVRSAAVNDACVQVLFMTGHGAEGGVATPGISGNRVLWNNMQRSSKEKWGCYANPFLREITLIACNTYHAKWSQSAVCPKLLLFNYKLAEGRVGAFSEHVPIFAGGSQLQAGLDHSPVPPHNLALP
jgi:hypothetical protein